MKAEPKYIVVIINGTHHVFSKIEMQGIFRVVGQDAVPIGAWERGLSIAAPFQGSCEDLAKKILDVIPTANAQITAFELGDDFAQLGYPAQNRSFNSISNFRRPKK